MEACDRVTKVMQIKSDLRFNGYLSDSVDQGLTKLVDESIKECRDPDKLSNIERQLSKISNPNKPTQDLLRRVQSMYVKKLVPSPIEK